MKLPLENKKRYALTPQPTTLYMLGAMLLLIGAALPVLWSLRAVFAEGGLRRLPGLLNDTALLGLLVSALHLLVKDRSDATRRGALCLIAGLFLLGQRVMDWSLLPGVGMVRGGVLALVAMLVLVIGLIGIPTDKTLKGHPIPAVASAALWGIATLRALLAAMSRTGKGGSAVADAAGAAAAGKPFAEMMDGLMDGFIGVGLPGVGFLLLLLALENVEIKQEEGRHVLLPDLAGNVAGGALLLMFVAKLTAFVQLDTYSGDANVRLELVNPLLLVTLFAIFMLRRRNLRNLRIWFGLFALCSLLSALRSYDLTGVVVMLLLLVGAVRVGSDENECAPKFLLRMLQIVALVGAALSLLFHLLPKEDVSGALYFYYLVSSAGAVLYNFGLLRLISGLHITQPGQVTARAERPDPFADVGGKIMGLARWLYKFNVFVALACIIVGAACFAVGLLLMDTEFFFYGLVCFGASVPFLLSIIGTWFIYAFGQITRNIDRMGGEERNNDDLPEL